MDHQDRVQWLLQMMILLKSPDDKIRDSAVAEINLFEESDDAFPTFRQILSNPPSSMKLLLTLFENSLLYSLTPISFLIRHLMNG
jgi:hypothetical protein